MMTWPIMHGAGYLKQLRASVSFVSFALFFAIAASAHAAPTSTPNVTFGTSNTVDSVIVYGTTTYIGGLFGSVAYNVHDIAKFNASSSAVDTSFPYVDTQTVYAIIPDGNGGWYVGGDFTYIGGVARNHIAHVEANGSIDPAFNPDVTGGGASVRRLALSSSGSILYAGGSFTTVGSSATSTRDGVAAFNTSDGSATSFNPGIGTGASTVEALALSPDGTTLYVGGNFTVVGTSATSTRNRLAAFSTADGSLDSFNPGMNSDVLALAVSPDNSTLYAGGSFTIVGTTATTTLNHLAAFTPASTSTPTSFNPNLNGNVNEIALSSGGTTLYAAGNFTTANGGGVSRSDIAAFTPASTSTPTSFNPSPNATVLGITLSPDGSVLYAGGGFSLVGSSVTSTRNGMASFNTADGSVTSFDPELDAGAQTIAVSPDGTTVVAGGTFLLANRVFRNRIASFNNSNGALNSFNPNVNAAVNAMALSPDGSTLYAVGSFTTVNGGTARGRVAAFSTVDGSVTSFNPNVSTGTVNALALSPDGSVLYVGGTFSGVNSVNGNTTRGELASFTTSNGSVTSFDPELGPAGTAVNALALSSSSVLYVGGSATSTNGILRSRLMAFTPLTTSTPTSFDPEILNGVVSSLQLTADGSVLYVGGTFTGANDISGTATRVRLMSVNTADGSLTSFDPRAGNQVLALALSNDGTTLYAGGGFTDVNTGTVLRNHLAAFTPASTSTPTSFNPNMSGNVNFLMIGSDNTLYVGGSFSTVGSEPALYPRSFYATFSDLPVAISSVSASPSSSGATITWTTGTAANSTAEYGADATYGNSVTAPDGGAVTSHSVSLTGLSACTVYHYRVDSANLYSNFATSTDGTFTTTGCAPAVVVDVPSGGGGGGGGYVSSAAPVQASAPVAVSLPAVASTFPASSSIGAAAPTSSRSLTGEISALLTALDKLFAGQLTKNLKAGMTDPEVRLLQEFLNCNGYPVASSGPGSPGQETTKFGAKTAVALAKFQAANGISTTGYFGPATRALLASK